MGIDDVQPVPVPLLHIHLAQAILVIACYHQPAAHLGQLAGQIQRRLFAHSFDDDIAEVAVEALTGEGHEGRVYEVTGPELLTFADMASLLSEIHGRDVQYLPVGFDEFHAAVAADAGPEIATMLTELCREVFDGRNESITSGAIEALGRPPRDARTVLTEAARVGARA